MFYLRFETGRGRAGWGQAALSFSVARRGLSYRLELQVAGGAAPMSPHWGRGRVPILLLTVAVIPERLLRDQRGTVPVPVPVRARRARAAWRVPPLFLCS